MTDALAPVVYTPPNVRNISQPSDRATTRNILTTLEIFTRKMFNLPSFRKLNESSRNYWILKTRPRGWRRCRPLLLCIDLTRRDGGAHCGSNSVSRKYRWWMMFDGNGRHRRSSRHSKATDTTGATIITKRIPVHTSTTADVHLLTFDRR